MPTYKEIAEWLKFLSAASEDFFQRDSVRQKARKQWLERAAAIESMGWQPISTAPKDGTVVLVYRPDAYGWGGKVDLAYWDDDRYAKKPRPYWHSARLIIDIQESRRMAPTHWMPLPDPPGGE